MYVEVYASLSTAFPISLAQDTTYSIDALIRLLQFLLNCMFLNSTAFSCVCQLFWVSYLFNKNLFKLISEVLEKNLC